MVQKKCQVQDFQSKAINIDSTQMYKTAQQLLISLNY